MSAVDNPAQITAQEPTGGRWSIPLLTRRLTTLSAVGLAITCAAAGAAWWWHYREFHGEYVAFGPRRLAYAEHVYHAALYPTLTVAVVTLVLMLDCIIFHRSAIRVTRRRALAICVLVVLAGLISVLISRTRNLSADDTSVNSQTTIAMALWLGAAILVVRSISPSAVTAALPRRVWAPLVVAAVGAAAVAVLVPVRVRGPSVAAQRWNAAHHYPIGVLFAAAAVYTQSQRTPGSGGVTQAEACARLRTTIDSFDEPPLAPGPHAADLATFVTQADRALGACGAASVDALVAVFKSPVANRIDQWLDGS